MTVMLPTCRAVSKVSPRALRAYVEAQGWNRIEPSGDKGDVYGHDQARQSVLIPGSSQYPDYVHAVRRILEMLSEFEGRDQFSILRDLSFAEYDLVRIRFPSSSEGGSITVDAALVLFEQSRKLLLAAACSTSRPKRVFESHPTKRAADYLKTVRVGQTEQGSFVMPLLSPVAPALNGSRQATFPFGGSADPFPRQVTKTLVSGLRSAREAADLSDMEAAGKLLSQRVHHGVSANLCDATAELISAGGGLDVSVSWALTVGKPLKRVTTKFRESDKSVLLEAAKILTSRPDRRGFRIAGPVSSLARKHSEDTGRIVVSTVIDGRATSVRIDLLSNGYEQALAAHMACRIVTVTGDLIRGGKEWFLKDPRKFQVMDKPSS